MYIHAYKYACRFPDTGCMHRPCEHRLRLRVNHARIRVYVYVCACACACAFAIYIYIYIYIYIDWGWCVSRKSVLMHVYVCVCVRYVCDTPGCIQTSGVISTSEFMHTRHFGELYSWFFLAVCMHECKVVCVCMC